MFVLVPQFPKFPSSRGKTDHTDNVEIQSLRTKNLNLDPVSESFFSPKDPDPNSQFVNPHLGHFWH